MKKVNIYDIQFTYENNKVYLKNKEKIGTFNFNYDDYNYDDIYKILSHDKEYKNIYDKMKLGETYYMVEEDPWNIVGIISLCKEGYIFIDYAEYDDRVIIKSAFPDKICNIIGE